MIPTEVMSQLLTLPLSKPAIKLYLYLRQRRNNETELAWPGRKAIIRDIAISNRDIAPARDELKMNGLINFDKPQSGKKTIVSFNDTEEEISRCTIVNTIRDTTVNTIDSAHSEYMNYTNELDYNELNESITPAALSTTFIDFEDLFDVQLEVVKTNSDSIHSGTPSMNGLSKQQKMNELQKKWDLATDWETKREIEAEFKQVYNLTF